MRMPLVRWSTNGTSATKRAVAAVAHRQRALLRVQAGRQPPVDHVHPERSLEGGGAVGLVEGLVFGGKEVEFRLGADIHVQPKRCLVDRQHFFGPSRRSCAISGC